MKNRLIFLLLAVVLTASPLYSQTSGKTYTMGAEELEQWIGYLASDRMKGRQNGSPEMAEAAEWIAMKFKEFGLVPVYPDGEFIQPYSFRSRQGASIDERNVVGILEGSDPDLKDEYIIVTAHFDHVGIRNAVQGDSIYNGADDNAAGTCTLLGIAKTLKENNYRPGRSILFASVSGEEMGLHGSRHLASDMPLPLHKAYANINFEMTGHSEYLGRDRYYMTGCDFSNLDDVIQEFSRETDYVLVDTIAVASRLFYASDNVAFAVLNREENLSTGIPCGTFATTTHGDYIHTPRDEAALFDFENMAALVDHFAHMVLWLSHSDREIVWTDPGFRRPDPLR